MQSHEASIGSRHLARGHMWALWSLKTATGTAVIRKLPPLVSVQISIANDRGIWFQIPLSTLRVAVASNCLSTALVLKIRKVPFVPFPGGVRLQKIDLLLASNQWSFMRMPN